MTSAAATGCPRNHLKHLLSFNTAARDSHEVIPGV